MCAIMQLYDREGAWNLQYLETLKLNDNQFFMHGMPSIFIGQKLSKMSQLMHLYLQNVSLQFKQFNELVRDGAMNLKTLKVDKNDITITYDEIHWKMPKLEVKYDYTNNNLTSVIRINPVFFNSPCIISQFTHSNKIWRFQ